VATIIKPNEVPKYVPGAVTAASDDLGWNGVWLRGYRYTGLDVIVPPVSDFTRCCAFSGAAAPFLSRIAFFLQDTRVGEVSKCRPSTDAISGDGGHHEGIRSACISGCS
jgi:hypothetical protein